MKKGTTIMKTTYQKPTTEMIFLNVQPILAGSPLKTDSVSGDVTEGELQSGNATGAALGRQSLWDDNEE